MPPPVDAVFVTTAQGWTALFGDVRRSVLPQAFVGAVFVLALIAATLRERYHPESFYSVGRAGLALAWFGLGVAGLISLTRLGYFAEHPDQVYAARYLPWSSLAWAGLLTAAIAHRYAGTIPLIAAAIVPVLVLAAEVGMPIAMGHAREVANDTALAAVVVGVWPDSNGLGETDPEITQNAARLMLPLHLGPFAWPEGELIGQPVPFGAIAIETLSFEFSEPRNGININEVRVMVVSKNLPCHSQRALVADAAGVVIGLLRLGGHNDRWQGAAIRYPDTSSTIYIRCPASQLGTARGSD